MFLVRAAFAAHDPTQSYTTVLHYKTDDPVTYIDDFLGGVVGSLTDGLRATLWTSGTLDSVTAVRIPAPGSSELPVEGTLVINLAGTYTITQDDIPQAICGLVDLKTNIASRRARGWTYGYPIFDSSKLDGSGEHINSASTYGLGLATLAAALDNQVEGSVTNYDPVVFSKTAYRSGDPTYAFEITAGVRNLKPRWLKKRSLAHS